MKTITLGDFCDFISYATPEIIYDDETGAEWEYDDSDIERDGCGRYINDITGEVLFQDEIDKYYIKGIELTSRKHTVVYIGKDA